MQTHNAEYVDVRIINGEDAAMLKSLVPEEQCTIVVDDVEQLVLAAEKDLNTSHSNAAEWFDEYHTYEEIIGWYEDIASDYERITKYVPNGLAASSRNRSPHSFSSGSSGASSCVHP